MSRKKPHLRLPNSPEPFGSYRSKTKPRADHPDTLTSMANLASTCRSQGRLGEAEKLDMQVIETRKTKLRVDHPNTLTSMNDLAFT